MSSFLEKEEENLEEEKKLTELIKNSIVTSITDQELTEKFIKDSLYLIKNIAKFVNMLDLPIPDEINAKTLSNIKIKYDYEKIILYNNYIQYIIRGYKSYINQRNEIDEEYAKKLLEQKSTLVGKQKSTLVGKQKSTLVDKQKSTLVGGKKSKSKGKAKAKGKVKSNSKVKKNKKT